MLEVSVQTFMGVAEIDDAKATTTARAIAEEKRIGTAGFYVNIFSKVLCAHAVMTSTKMSIPMPADCQLRSMGNRCGTTEYPCFRAVVDLVSKCSRFRRTQLELFFPQNAYLNLCRTSKLWVVRHTGFHRCVFISSTDGAIVSKTQSARDAKQAAEIPTWRDFDNAESTDGTTTACGESSEPYSSDVEGAPEPNSALTRSAQTIAALVRTEKGHVKLLDQNNETRRVVRDAIIDAKGYIIFVDAYPELVDKNQVALQSLLTVAANRGVHAIKECLRTDAQYAAHLASLVEPRIPLLRRDLKVSACTNIDTYFRLSNNVVKAKKLMEQHAYIYALKFDLNDDASPIGKKPYQGDLLIFLIYEAVFSGAKSIGIKFVERFAKLANNKGNRPECPIPLLALVATAVYAALFWKTLGSPGKFNFTGNQFSETYVFHVKFLEDLKRDAPGKFHCMMADIYEAVQTLKRKGNDHFINEHRDALGLLDLDGMADD
ncbi:hypothetical protein EDD22DRAFT_974195 [Suillus occidentalis]|nr:hypothetical protein EDD22DRAFT_974195 [Suillus occidentalis]